MKRVFLFIITLLPVLAFGQQAPTPNFLVTGKIGKLTSPARAYLYYQLGANRVVDSADVVNGNFVISGFIGEPSNSILLVSHDGSHPAVVPNDADVLHFFLAQGSTNVSSSKDSVKNAVITGSVINDDDKYLDAQLKPINAEAKQLKQEVDATPKDKQNTPQFQRDMQARYKVLQDRYTHILKEFVATHSKSYMSLLVINQLGSQGADPLEIDALYNALDPSLKQMEMAKVLKANIDKSKATSIGSLAPDFTQADVDGKPVTLSSLRGKYVLIDFWASWCGPCRAENPNVVKAYNKFKDKNFTILGVSLDQPGDKVKWQNAIKNDGLTWTQVSDLKYWGNQAAVLYRVQSIPANFLIDPTGKIIGKDLRGTDLEDKLEAVLR
jgi:peroxiredoxin